MQSKQNISQYVPTINTFNFNAPNNLPRQASTSLSNDTSGQIFYNECRSSSNF